ncbi:hypothetical protein F4823DRAFT_620185 [Ustulina deusta]|nr:hypothetical protein F4823DRAFT_620185 [Ustulina deusta]
MNQTAMSPSIWGKTASWETRPCKSYRLPPTVYPHLLLITSYLKHCQYIVAILNSSLAMQLNLPRDAFTSLQSPTKPSGTVIRFLNALASPESNDLRTALIRHADFGTITLLANVVGGLQIL